MNNFDKRSRASSEAALLALVLFGLAGCDGGPAVTTQGELLGAVRVATFKDGAQPARQLAFSHDSRLIATTNVDGSVVIRGALDRRVLARAMHSGGATSIAFGPDDRWFVTGGYDGTVRTWGVTDGAPIRTFAGSQGVVWTVDVSPDGTQIASAGEDKLVHLWSVADGKQLRAMRGHTLNIWQVCFSPDGKVLASGGFDHTIKLWNLASGKPAKDIAGHEQAVVGLDFSPDGRSLASGGDDSRIKLWRAFDGTLVRSTDDRNHVYSLDFSGDGKWLAAGGRARGAAGTLWHQLTGAGADGNAISLWRVSDGALMQRIEFADDVVSVGLSPDGMWLAGSSENGEVAIWRLTARAAGSMHQGSGIH